MQTTPRPKTMKKSVSEKFWETYPQPFCSCQYLLWSVSEVIPHPLPWFYLYVLETFRYYIISCLSYEWFGILVSMHDIVLFLTLH